MRYRVLYIVLLLCMVGCIKDPAVEPIKESGSKLFTLSLETFSNEVVGSTRSSGSENDIYRGYILFYSASGAYKGYEDITQMEEFSRSGSKVSFEPTGDNFTTKDKIIAIFNFDEAAVIPSNSQFGDITSENLSEYFPLSAEYLSKVEAEMKSGTYSLGMPMYANDFADSDRAKREIFRSVARMELFIKKGLKITHDSHTHTIGASSLEYAIVNSAQEGSVGVGKAISAPSYSKLESLGEDLPYTLTEYEGSALDTKNKVYLFAYPYATRTVKGEVLEADSFSEDRFSIILKHLDENVTTSSEEARYYKLNLLDKATSTYFDVKQNHSYRVVITAVNSRGYATMEEAYKMPPSNIEYEIYDDKGGFTYSNGQYAISMDDILSYDEVLLYGSNESTIEFNNIRYVLPDGGQMDDAAFITNEVLFNVISTEGVPGVDQWTPAPEFTANVTSDFSFDASGRSVLTSKGQSIKLTIKGEGVCTIQLKIKLGNLDLGRDEIKIKKIAISGDGDGSFDAHPNHIEIAGQRYIENSWQSDDLDFGARASSSAYDDCGDNGVVIYMGENATPTGYRTMDGYVSGENAINSYPVFSPKSRKGYYSYKDSNDETRKVMIQLNQLAPFYLGHFGNTSAEGSLYHYNALVCEKIEEIEHDNGWAPVTPTNGVMEWSKGLQTYYKGLIWGDIHNQGARYHNLVDGFDISRSIVEDNSYDETNIPSAAHYCYMKNDINGDGVIDPATEPIRWCLPAQNQLLAMWINMNVFQSDIDLYRLNNENGDGRVYYWSCSEVDDQDAESANETTFPNDFTTFALGFNMLEGQAEPVKKNNGYYDGQCHVRCVRGLH